MEDLDKIKEKDNSLAKASYVAGFVPALVLAWIVGYFFEIGFWPGLLWVVLLGLAWSFIKWVVISITFRFLVKEKAVDKQVTVLKEFNFPRPEDYHLENPEDYFNEVYGEVDPKKVISASNVTEINIYRSSTGFNLPALMRTLSIHKEALKRYQKMNKKEDNEIEN